MENNPESIEFIDDVTETQTKKEKDIHKHNDKIDASNLQSKSFQAVSTFRSKLSSQTFWNNNLKWTETWILWHSSRPGLKSWSFACMLQILTFLHQIILGIETMPYLGPCPAGLRYIPVVWDFSVHDLNCVCKLGTVHAWLDSINQSAFPYPGQIQSITK